jgi:hypothetical protein
MLIAEGGARHVAFLALESWLRCIEDLRTARKVRGVREGRE